MKILFTLFVLLFSSSTFANNFYCNVTAHGFEGNEWRNYPDNVFLITYDNKNLIMTDTMINADWNFKIIKNDNDHISAIIATESMYGMSPYLESIIFYKEELYIIFAYIAENGVTINKGQCFRK